jgi:hypothetical protein
MQVASVVAAAVVNQIETNARSFYTYKPIQSQAAEISSLSTMTIAMKALAVSIQINASSVLGIWMLSKLFVRNPMYSSEFVLESIVNVECPLAYAIFCLSKKKDRLCILYVRRYLVMKLLKLDLYCKYTNKRCLIVPA